MSRISRLLLASALALPLLGTGCADHRQVYVWGPNEQPYYVQWEHETHRDHVAWEQRNEKDRRDYWKWRKHHHE